MNILINSGTILPFLGSRKKLVLDIISRGHNVFISGFQNQYSNDINDLGAKYLFVNFERTKTNPFSDLSLYFQYLKIIKMYNIEVVHSYTIKPNIYGSLAAKRCGIKKIFPTVNGVGYVFSDDSIAAIILRFLVKIMYRFAFLKVQKVFFHNRDDLNLFNKYKIVTLNQGVVINGSGIDTNFFNEKPIQHFDYFLFASRLLMSKGIMEYVKAAAIVKKKYPQAVFFVAGQFDSNPKSIKYSDLHKEITNNTIVFLGNVEDIKSVIDKVSVVVLPSYREGVPHILLEALSMGRAVITTNVPGCKETVVDGENGFLVDKMDFNNLAQKMMTFIDNRPLLIEFGHKSRQLAESKFSLEKVNSIIISTMDL